MMLLTSAVLTKGLFMLADATGDVDIQGNAVHSVSGEMLELVFEIVIVCLVFGFTTTLVNRAGHLKKPAKGKLKKLATEPATVRKSVCTSEEIASYHTALRQQADAGNLSGCANLCKEMRARNIEPSERTFMLLFEACINAEDFDRACSLLEDLCQTGTPVSVTRFQECLQALVEVGRVDEARALLEKSKRVFGFHPQAFLCKQLAVACARSSNETSTGRISTAMNEALGSAGANSLNGRCENVGSRLQASSLSVATWRASQMLGSEATQRDSPVLVQRTDEASRSSNRLNQFIDLNRLDERCADMLRRLPVAQSEWVMDQQFILEMDETKTATSTRVLSTILQTESKTNKFWNDYPANFDLAKRLSDFVHINKLDARCAKTLERLSADGQRWVMDQEFVIQVDSSKGTAAAKVIGQVMKLKKNMSNQ